MYVSATTLALLAVAWQPTGIRWNTNRLPVPYCITSNSVSTSLNATAQRQAVLDGINAWVATSAGGGLSCTSFAAANATVPCRTVVDGNDQRPNFFWQRNWTYGRQTIGVTSSFTDRSSCGQVTDDTGRVHNLQCTFDADIELNDVDYTWTNNGRTGTDIQTVMAHEYGHFIGLDHCNNNNTCTQGNAVMYAAYTGALRVLFNDDVQGACAMYPGVQGGIGAPCTANNQCTSNLCINVAGDQYCSQTCGNCPTGFRCGPNPTNTAQQVCLRDNGLNRNVCETCISGADNACANNGLCVNGIPEQNQGRCVEPCAAGNTCDPQFRCQQVTLRNGTTGNFCFPRSSDCNNLNNFSTLQLGQNCDGDPPCDTGLTCVGICSIDCTDGTACPTDWGCTPFNDGRSYCIPEVNEGEGCEGFQLCTTGPCLAPPNSSQFICYQDCAGDPSRCNNAQTCTTYTLQGGGSVSVCEPPGALPLPPDAGVIIPDSGIPPDSGVGAPDTGVVVNPDAGPMSMPDAGSGSGVCACDRTFDCDEDPDNPGFACLCDPECNCGCDRTFACDQDENGQDCSCDPECNCPCNVTDECDLVNGQPCGCDGACFRTSSSGCTCSASERSRPTWGLIAPDGGPVDLRSAPLVASVAPVRQVR